MVDSKSRPARGVAAKGETKAEGDEGSTDPALGPEESTMFRPVASRLNFRTDPT